MTSSPTAPYSCGSLTPSLVFVDANVLAGGKPFPALPTKEAAPPPSPPRTYCCRDQALPRAAQDLCRCSDADDCQCSSPSSGCPLEAVVAAGRAGRPAVMFPWLEIFDPGTHKGYGLRPTRAVPAGAAVAEYVGEVLKWGEARRRVDETTNTPGAPQYLVVAREHCEAKGLTLRTAVDASRFCNLARFINHSCDPNLVMTTVRPGVAGPLVPRLVLFAARDIKAFEELSFSYGGRSNRDDAGGGGDDDHDNCDSPRTAKRRRRRRSQPPPPPPPPPPRGCRCQCGASGCAGFLPHDPLFDDDED